MATEEHSNEPVEARLSLVSAGLETAAAQLQELVAQMRMVLSETKVAEATKEKDGSKPEDTDDEGEEDK